MVLPVIMSLL